MSGTDRVLSGQGSFFRAGLARLARREVIAQKVVWAITAALSGLVFLSFFFGVWVLAQPAPTAIAAVDVPEHLLKLYDSSPVGDQSLGRLFKWISYGITAGGFVLMVWRMNVLPMLLAFIIGGGFFAASREVSPPTIKPAFSTLSYEEAVDVLRDLPSLDLDAKAYVQAQLAMRFKRDPRASVTSVAKKIRQGALSFDVPPATAYAIEIAADGRAVSPAAIQGAKAAEQWRDKIERIAMGFGMAGAAVGVLILKAVGVHQILRRRRKRIEDMVLQIEADDPVPLTRIGGKPKARSLLKEMFTG